jgi:hypothetical protein
MIEPYRERINTVEIVVEEVPWKPPRRHLVLVAVKGCETALHARIGKAGGRWTGNGLFWRVRYDRAVKLEPAARIRADQPTSTKASICGDQESRTCRSLLPGLRHEASARTDPRLQPTTS